MTRWSRGSSSTRSASRLVVLVSRVSGDILVNAKLHTNVAPSACCECRQPPRAGSRVGEGSFDGPRSFLIVRSRLVLCPVNGLSALALGPETSASAHARDVGLAEFCGRSGSEEGESM